MLQVVLPHSFVLSAIDVFVDTRPICLVVGPEAVVYVSVDVRERTLSVGSVLSPFAIVTCPVRPDLDTHAVTETALPLAGVNRTCLELIRLALFARLVRVI